MLTIMSTAREHHSKLPISHLRGFVFSCSSSERAKSRPHDEAAIAAFVLFLFVFGIPGPSANGARVLAWSRLEFNCALEYSPAPQQRIAYPWEDSIFDASLFLSIFSEFTAMTDSFFSLFFPRWLHLLENMILILDFCLRQLARSILRPGSHAISL